MLDYSFSTNMAPGDWCIGPFEDLVSALESLSEEKMGLVTSLEQAKKQESAPAKEAPKQEAPTKEQLLFADKFKDAAQTKKQYAKRPLKYLPPTEDELKGHEPRYMATWMPYFRQLERLEKGHHKKCDGKKPKNHLVILGTAMEFNKEEPEHEGRVVEQISKDIFSVRQFIKVKTGTATKVFKYQEGEWVQRTLRNSRRRRHTEYPRAKITNGAGKVK